MSTPEQVEAAADLLATQMARTWSRQVVDWGIQSPTPVRVRWQWADPQLAVPREQLNASAPAGTDPPPIPGTAVGEVLSSGLVTRLHDRVYARLRHGRLVLIGGPGVGKTAAMILLLLQALRHRAQLEEGDRSRVPVPVWLTLGSWNPVKQGLREWVSTTMARDHPYLRVPEFGPDAIGALLDAGQVALFLDGLDEMPDAYRAKAIERLQAEAGGLRVVLTSRPDEYATTQATGTQLADLAVVDLQPVGVPAAVDYLLADRAKPARQAWTQLTDRLQNHPGGVLAQTLNTPLALSLARAAHPSDPAPLLADPALDTEPALRRYLLDQVLVTAYPNPRERDHATYWLGWIARCMGTGRDLYWWDIPTWTPRRQRRLMLGLMSGLASGLAAGPATGLAIGLVIGNELNPLLWLGLFAVVIMAGATAGLVVGPTVGLAARLKEEPRRLDVRLPRGRELPDLLTAMFKVGSVAGLAVGAGLGLTYGLAGLMLGLVGGLVAGLVVGPTVGLAVGLARLWGRPLPTTGPINPIEVFHSDRRHTIAVVLTAILAAGFGAVLAVVLGAAAATVAVYADAADIEMAPLAVLLAGRSFGAFGVGAGFLAAATLGLGAGLVFGVGPAAQLNMVTLQWRLRGQRVQLIPLLQTAHERQVLRQVGTLYQFRHADLQDRLAERFARDHLRAGAPAEVQPGSSGRGPDVMNLTTPAPVAAEGAGPAEGKQG